MYIIVYIHGVYTWYVRYVYSVYGGPRAKTKSQKWRPPTTMLYRYTTLTFWYIVVQQQCIHILRSQDVKTSWLLDYIPRWLQLHLETFSFNWLPHSLSLVLVFYILYVVTHTNASKQDAKKQDAKDVQHHIRKSELRAVPAKDQESDTVWRPVLPF